MAKQSNNSNYSILIDAELNLKSIEQQLKSKKYNIVVEEQGIKQTTESLKELEQESNKASNSAEKLGLSYQEAQLIMQKSIDTISAMVEQVYELNKSTTEFRKVSDLSGKSLDNYVAKLSQMGNQVARTGKPKCLSQNVGMVNQH